MVHFSKASATSSYSFQRCMLNYISYTISSYQYNNDNTDSNNSINHKNSWPVLVTAGI